MALGEWQPYMLVQRELCLQGGQILTNHNMVMLGEARLATKWRVSGTYIPEGGVLWARRLPHLAAWDRHQKEEWDELRVSAEQLGDVRC